MAQTLISWEFKYSLIHLDDNPDPICCTYILHLLFSLILPIYSFYFDQSDLVTASVSQ